MTKRVAVVGLGYVGLPVAMGANRAGYDVVGIDVDPERIKRLDLGETYVEDVSDRDLAAAFASGRFEVSSDYEAADGFDIAVVTVPTPLREGVPDLSYIEASAQALAPRMKRACCVILESTTYPGTTEELFAPILEEGSGLAAGEGFHLGYSPERIDPGNKTFTLERTPKVVAGIDAASLQVVSEFYSSFVDEVVEVSGTREAELAKLIENTFRHVNIALVNELAMFASDLGVDVWESIDAASSKPFGFMRFEPGPGVGGHCLPIDPSFLSWRVRRHLGHTFRFVELANDVNDHMPDFVVRRLSSTLNQVRKPLNGSRVLMLGVTYKPNSGDAREAPAERIADLLGGAGADVVAYDPYYDESAGWGPSYNLVELTAEEVAAADAVLVVTPHDNIDFDLVTEHAQLILDTRNRLQGPNVEHL